MVESLRHYNCSIESLTKIFEEHLIDYENRLRRDGSIYLSYLALESKAIFQNPIIEKFVIPPRYFKGHLEHFFKSKLYKA